MGHPAAMPRLLLTVTDTGKATVTAVGTAAGTTAGWVTILAVIARTATDPGHHPMKRVSVLFMVAASLLVATARAHDAPNLEHIHAFERTGYGSYRQGHVVNGPQGDIIIWSPRSYTGYRQAPTVRFARPEPITKAPGNPGLKIRSEHQEAPGYGKKQRSPYQK
jgi:hypothetical protein